MARIGRIDISFTHRDKLLWEYIEKLEKGERGYWLKHFALIGIATMQNNKNPNLGTPIILELSQLTDPLTSVSDNVLLKPERKKKQSTKKIFKDPHESDISLPPSTKQDPLDKRKAAMANFIQPDSDLLKALLEDSTEQLGDNQEIQINHNIPDLEVYKED